MYIFLLFKVVRKKFRKLFKGFVDLFLIMKLINRNIFMKNRAIFVDCSIKKKLTKMYKKKSFIIRLVTRYKNEIEISQDISRRYICQYWERENVNTRIFLSFLCVLNICLGILYKHYILLLYSLVNWSLIVSIIN